MKGPLPGTCGAVVLAAGDSSRMGFPKALLDLDGRPFLVHLRAALAAAGVGEVRVVLGHDAVRIRAVVPLPDHEVVVNPHPEAGMLSSLLLGLGALPPSLAGFFVCPVDHPRTRAGTLVDLAGVLRPGGIVVPVHEGRRGHPVLFAADLLGELLAAPPDRGARAVVWAVPERVTERPTGPDVLVDIDRPEDYEALVSGRRSADAESDRESDPS